MEPSPGFGDIPTIVECLRVISRLILERVEIEAVGEIANLVVMLNSYFEMKVGASTSRGVAFAIVTHAWDFFIL